MSAYMSTLKFELHTHINRSRISPEIKLRDKTLTDVIDYIQGMSAAG